MHGARSVKGLEERLRNEAESRQRAQADELLLRRCERQRVEHLMEVHAVHCIQPRVLEQLRERRPR